MSELALNGGPAAAEALETPEWPQCTEQTTENVLDAVESGSWCSSYNDATWVDRFEERFGEYHDAENALAVANGTVAIEVALRMLDVRPGDEVLVPPYTFIATASAVTSLGAIPRFVDVDPETYNVDPDAIKEAVTDRTVGLIGVHISGYPMDFDRLLPVLREHDLFLVEDAAHAQGTEWKGEKVGTIGDVGAFSFQESKSLAGGDGGMVVTDDDILAERAHLLRNIGRSGNVYRHYELTSNCRMTEFQGAVLCAQLDKFPEEMEQRRRNDQLLRAELADVDCVSHKPEDDRITARGYCLYDLRYDPVALDGLPRDTFLEALSAEGVPVSKGYVMPLYEQPAFRRETVQALVPDDVPVPAYGNLYLPGAEEVTNRNICLSHGTLLAEEDGVRAIADAIRKVAQNADELR